MTTISPSVQTFIKRHEDHGWQKVTDPADLNFSDPHISTLYYEFHCPCTDPYLPGFNFTVRRTAYETYNRDSMR